MNRSLCCRSDSFGTPCISSAGLFRSFSLHPYDAPHSRFYTDPGKKFSPVHATQKPGEAPGIAFSFMLTAILMKVNHIAERSCYPLLTIAV